MNIGLHGGIVEEKHRQAMGQAIWLYMWLVKRQTRRNGLVLGGSPLTLGRICGETHYPEGSMRRWLRELRSGGYIEVTYLNFKMLRIRILKAKKFGVTQSDFPFSHRPNLDDTKTKPSSKSERRVRPNLDDTPSKSGRSKQSLTMSSNETPETPRAMPDGIAGLIPLATWLEFVAMRKSIRKPLMPGGAELLLRKLLEFQAAGDDPVAVIEQSTLNGWAGIFPLKGKVNGGTKSDQRAERTDTALDRVFGKPEKMAENLRRALPPSDH